MAEETQLPEDHAARGFIADLMQRFRAEGKFLIEISLTPALARVLDRLNKQTFVRGPAALQCLKDDLVSGLGTLRARPIVLADDGSFVDGKTRCRAVIETGINLPVNLLVGCPLATAPLIDGDSTPLSKRHELALSGVSNPGHVEAARTLLSRYYTSLMINPPKRGNRESAAKRRAFRADHPAIPKAVEDVLKAIKDNRTAQNKTAPVGVLAAALLITTKEYPAKAAEFLNAVLTSTGFDRENPAFVLRERFLSDKQIVRPRVSHGRSLGLYLTAWNLHVTGKKAQVLRFSEHETHFPIVLGIPKISAAA